MRTMSDAAARGPKHGSMPKRAPRPRAARGPRGRRPAIFTAIDSTLLDARTFDPGVNRRVVRRLAGGGIPIVPVTVMTLEEIAPLARELGLRDAMIVEAGGAIARWTGGGWAVEPCGPDADALLDAIREIEDRSGATLLVYSALPEIDAARLSGRSGERLRTSTERAFSEPFVIEQGNLEDVEHAAASIGFTIRRGRRFLYLCRGCDEGDAFLRLRDELQCDPTIALGGSPIDAEFLARADIPIIIPAANGEPDPELMAMVPHARIALDPAPQGWAESVEAVLAELSANRLTPA